MDFYIFIVWAAFGLVYIGFVGIHTGYKDFVEKSLRGESLIVDGKKWRAVEVKDE